jgi:hypothetical protein
MENSPPKIEPPVVMDKREKSRRRIVQLIWIVYWLTIFDGALRKWVFPGQEKQVMFLKDVFVMLIYFRAFLDHLWPKRMAVLSGVVIAVLTVLTVIQSLTSGYPFPVLAFGWKMYVFYIPLAFIIGENFKGKDLKSLVKYSLLLAIPYSLLIYRQFHAGPADFINKSVGEVIYSETGARGGSVARVTGTFTFFHGEQIFAAALVAFMLICWLLPAKHSPLNKKLLYLATAAILVIVGLDFTRGTFILSALVILSSVLSSFIIKKGALNFKAVFLPLLIVFLGMSVFSRFFGKAKEIRENRAFSASSDTSSRVDSIFTDYKRVLGRVPLLGYGIGVSGRGSQYLKNQSDVLQEEEWENLFSERRVSAGEEEWPRIIYELGSIFGVMFIIYRLSLVKWLFSGAVKAGKRSGNPFPILLVGCISMIIAVWYICHISPVNGLGWLFAGFCVAANRLGEAETQGNLWG